MTFATSSGSVENLNVSLRQGLTPHCGWCPADHVGRDAVHGAMARPAQGNRQPLSHLVIPCPYRPGWLCGGDKANAGSAALPAGSRQQAAGKSPLGVMLMVVHSAVIAVTLSSKGFRRARPRRSTRLRAASPSIPRIVCSGCRQAKRPVKLAHPAFLLAIATALGLGRESLRHTHSDLEEPGCAHPSADAHRETAHRTLRIGASIRRAFRLRPSSFIHGGERMVSHSPVARARCR